MDDFLMLFDLLGLLARRRLQSADRHFAALQLNHTEARLLSLLHQEGGLATQESLSNSLFVDRTNTGRALKHLERRGLVAKHRDQVDKRANHIEITPKGRKSIADLAKLRRTMAQTFFGDLKATEAAQIVTLLKKAITDEEYQTLKKRARHTLTSKS